MPNLNKIVWSNLISNRTPEVKEESERFVMDNMPFNSIINKDLSVDQPLKYIADGKFISFKPISIITPTLNRKDNKIEFNNALGIGISIEVEINSQHWKKLIKIDSLESLGDISEKEFVEFKFLIESDFDIPIRENIKPRIQLGDNSFLEVAQAWDSSSDYSIEHGDIENKIEINSFFHIEDEQLYFTKRISVEWLKSAVFPVFTDVDITYGTNSEFESNTTSYCQCCEIDTNKFAIIYTDDVDAGIFVIVGTVSGTTITWGTRSQPSTGYITSGGVGICKLDTDKFAVAFGDAGAANDGFTRAASVSTRTISWGSAVEFLDSDTVSVSCCQLGTDKYAIVYNDNGASAGKCTICTTSGTTITAGTAVSFEGSISYTECCKLDTDKFVAFYRDGGDSSHGKVCVFSVSGTVPTAEEITEIQAATTTVLDCMQLDTNKFLIMWYATTTKMEICTVSGSAITEGAVSTLNLSIHAGATKIDSTHFAVAYRDYSNSGKGTSNYCSFSGTTITQGSNEVFLNSTATWVNPALISANKIVVAYRDDADGGDIGEAMIGDTPAPAATGWTGKIGGITNPSKIGGISVDDIEKVGGIESDS